MSRADRKEETVVEASFRMAGAVESALVSSLDNAGHDRLSFYSDLTDNQLHGFHEALWEYTQDLRNEWVRREMLKQRSEELEQ